MDGEGRLGPTRRSARASDDGSRAGNWVGIRAGHWVGIRSNRSIC